MRRLRLEHRRLLDNGWCTRPAKLDGAFETICVGCGFVQTTIAFRDTLEAQHDDAASKGQDGRAELFANLLDSPLPEPPDDPARPNPPGPDGPGRSPAYPARC